MIRKDIIVKRPEGTKIYRQRGCVYVYQVTGKTYNSDKRYVVEDRKCIGKMINDTEMNPNENYFEFYDDAELGEAEVQHPEAVKIAMPLLVRRIMQDLQLQELLSSIHGTEAAALIEDLITYMITKQTSVMQHYDSFAWEHLCVTGKYIDDSKISEFLKKDISYMKTEIFQHQWNRMQTEHNSVWLCYDSTNMNTDAEGIEMAEFGHAKDDEDRPQVNISCAVDQESGTPLFYEMYPGSIIDNTQCTYMVDRAKEYGYKNAGLILDRGYFSTQNIRYFDQKGYDFLLMMKTGSKVLEEYLEEAILPLATKTKYYLPNHNVYGLTRTGKLGDDMTVRYFHIYYDNIRAGEEKNEYLKSLLEKEELLKKRVAEKIRRREDMGAFTKEFRLKYDDNGYLISYKRNENVIQKKADRLGFFVIVTSKKMSAQEALEIYRNRDSVEKIFRMLKSGLEYDTFRVHSQSSLEGKTHVVFIAGIVRNHIYQKLKEIKGSDKKNYTVPAVINELEKIVTVQNGNGVYVRRYGLTKRQRKILEVFGVSEAYLNKAVAKLNKVN
jgi:transposase